MDCSKTNDDTMYPTEAPKEWLNRLRNRNRSRSNTNENYQRNPANYEYNEYVNIISNHSSLELNEEENYNDYKIDGRKSALTGTAVNTCYSKNIRNLDNVITHTQDGATHRDVKVNWNETNASDSKTSSYKNKCAEKTTYCRPVFNAFRQDFVYKAIERNAKLQQLLKKLVIARRKEKEEKERAEWNNYVNKLKNTGHYLSDESRHIEPQHMEPRHFESWHIEPQHMEPRHTETRYNQPRTPIYFGRNKQSHEFTNSPNSEAIYGPPYKSMYEHEQEHTEPARFNNHPEHKRVPVSTAFESGLENGPSFSIESSIDRLMTLANEWQSSTPHTIAADRPKSPSRIPVDSGKYKGDRLCETCLFATDGYCKACLFANRKEEESSREINPVTTTGGLCNTCPLANRKEESLRDTNPADTTGGLCKTCPFANRKEESLRDTNRAATTGGLCKTCPFANRKEESSRETNPATTTGSYCKSCLLANRNEESSRETNPATTTGSYCKSCLLANRKEESSRETNPATTTGSYCKSCLLANRKEESSRETNPATTTGSYCKSCLLANRKEESSQETYPATTKGGYCKACLLANRKEESSTKTYPPATTGGYCKACLLALKKEGESSRARYPATTMGGHLKTSLVPGRKEEESSRDTNPASTTGCCKMFLLASRKQECSNVTCPAKTMCGHCKTRLLEGMKKEDSSRETYPANTKSSYCKACLLAKKENNSRESYPATTTGDYCKACLLAKRKEESSPETYPATTTSGYCKACLIDSMKEEESSRETNAAPTKTLTINEETQTTSLENTNIGFIITDQVAKKETYDEITQNVNRLKNIIDLQDQENQRRNSFSGLETKMELLANSIKAILSKLESVKEVSGTSTARDSCVDKFNNIAKSTSVSCVNVVHETENMPKATNTGCDCGEPKRQEQALAQQAERPEQPERPGHPIDTFNLQTEYVVRPLPIKYRNISSSTSKIDKIMCEELVKSNQFRKDIEEILCQSNTPCAVQISFDIPTRERCTEITDSLSKTKVMEEQEISVQELSLSGDRNTQMTIAVNTDPLGLLAWFRMSSDTLKRLISYVPAVDYSRYLLRVPQLATAPVDYVCNICGASFLRPSQLNNHIRTHDLTDSRNCCICHHVLNIKPGSSRSAARFICRYCGQRFTRAYCCELHEQSCARALGRSHDVRSGHGLLT